MGMHARIGCKDQFESVASNEPSRCAVHQDTATRVACTFRAAWSDFVASLKPRRGGIASPVDKTLGRAGRPFVQLVLEALDANRITAVEASRYLDLRFDHIEKLRGELGSGAAGASAVDDGD